MMINEKHTAAKAATGDMAAFGQLIERYHVGVILYCEHFAKDRAIAEDIAQEGFLKAYQKLSTFQPEKAAFSTWLYRIVRNTCLDYLRSHKITYDMSQLDEMISDTQPISPGELLDIRTALEQLEPPIYQIIIKEFYWEGDSYAVIAERHQLPINTVRTNLRRAKEKLKGALL